jgi:DNA-directed RNA polymerase delta subunit
MSYIILRGLRFDGIVVNVQAPAEDKTDDMKDRVYAHYRQLNVDQCQV